MANHAKVCTGKTLNPDEINKIVQDLNKEKLGGIFNIEYEVNAPGGYANHQWFLSYKDDDYLAMVFWLSDDVAYGEYKNGEWIDFDDKKILSKQSCIEFRHGHSFRFMWWVEGVFRENLGKIFNAKMWDDGTGECEDAKPENFESFKSYLLQFCDKEEDLSKQKQFHFEPQKYVIPKELIETLNLDFEI